MRSPYYSKSLAIKLVTKATRLLETEYNAGICEVLHSVYYDMIKDSSIHRYTIVFETYKDILWLFSERFKPNKLTRMGYYWSFNNLSHNKRLIAIDLLKEIIKYET